jgi:hypothetical protein
MSIGAAMWRHVVSRVETVSRNGISSLPTTRVVNSVGQPALSLVHQLFFPSAAIRRTSVLFASVDEQSKASELCEQVAVALSNSSAGMVGIVEAGDSGETSPLKKGPASISRSVWPACTVPITEHVRRIPLALLCDACRSESRPGDGLKHLQPAFSHFLFSAAISDTEMPLLCRVCDAAVLVLTADVTRKQAALQAKKQLMRLGATLLGTVLDQRRLPIPESIYRRL